RQRRYINDQGDVSVAEDGTAHDTFDAAKILLEWFDDDLSLGDELIDQERYPSHVGFDDAHQGVGRARLCTGNAEDPVEPHEGQRLIANAHYLAASEYAPDLARSGSQ